MTFRLRAACLVLLVGVLSAQAHAADDVAAFYKGRTVTLAVGFGSGGGNDAYARMLARVMGRHMPGSPNIVIQNMPGAGSLRVANYLYNVAPKDGTVFGTFARNMPLLGLLQSDQNVQFDPRKFTWLGSASSYASDAYLLIARKLSATSTIAAARQAGGAPLLMGSTAEGASSEAMAAVLRDMLGFNLKLVSGYVDSATLFLALERGEVDARTVGLSALRSSHPDWIKPDGPMRVLVQFGRQTRHPDFPDVPLASELAGTAEQKHLIEILEVPYTLSRPYAAPPGVPVERAKALQAAFMAAQADPDYLADAAKLNVDISPIDGGAVLALINRIAETPREELKKVEKIIQTGG
jgi:tripartite-type tricarboxylate transporter receptor subunit TctC